MGVVILREGNIFENRCDLVVLPSSAKGTISPTTMDHVSKHTLAMPTPKVVGNVEILPFPGSQRVAKYYSYAASVEDDKCKVEWIEQIGAKLGRATWEYDEIKIVEAPLLGTGYGRLPVYLSAEYLKKGFIANAHPDSVLFVYNFQRDTVKKMKEYLFKNNVQYDVALSFAGEDRNVVENIEEKLTSNGIKVFYDSNEKAELWGKDLYRHLQEIYRDRAKFCIVIISKSYATKMWTRHELEQAQARAFKENREYILPVKLDETEFPFINDTVCYVDLRITSCEELAALVQKKLQNLWL